MLVKRAKRGKKEKPLPFRQVVCPNCAETLWTDPDPVEGIPPFTCRKCRYSWPPTVNQIVSRLRAEAEQRARGRPNTAKAGTKARQKRRKPSSNSVFSEKTRWEELYEKPMAEWTKAELRRWEKHVVPLMQPSNRGRPKDAEYDRAFAKRQLAEALDLPVPTYTELAGIKKPGTALRGQSATYDPKVDAVKQALKRRKERLIPDPVGSKNSFRFRQVDGWQ